MYRRWWILVYTLLLWELPASQGIIQKTASVVSAVKGYTTLQELFRNVTSAENKDVDSYNTDYTNLTELCSNHSNFLKASTTKLWALQMLDSSTRLPPEGLLAGALIHLGNMDECIGVRDVVWSNTSVFHGQHCLASLTIGKMSSASRMAGIDESVAAAVLKIAKCVPSSCNTEDTAALVKKDLALLDNYLSKFGYEFVVHVNELECHTTEKPELKTEDWVVVGVLYFFGVLVVLSTAYDIHTKKSDSRSNLMLAFSVYTNGQKLLAMSTSKSGDTLHCLHGIRFLSMCWVVFGHRYYVGMIEPSVNMPTLLMNFFSDWKRIGLANGTLSVDTFFLLSGLLVAYIFLKQVSKTNSFNLPLYYLHRYIRLTPALSVMMLLSATLWRYAGSGPVWDSTVHETAQTCSDNWWTNLLYVQNYVEASRMCVGQSWYLAVDMQLFWLSPLVLVPLWKWPVVGRVLLAVLTVGGLISNYVISYVYEIPAGGAGDVDVQNKFYYPTHARFVPYLIGVAFGYLLVEIKKREQPIKFTKMVTLLLWLLAVGIMLLTLCLAHIFYEPDYVYEPVGVSFYNALDRPGWAVGVGLVIFLCATEHGGFINTILSWQWFQVLNRLCYSVYLVHLHVMLSQYASLRVPVFLDDMLSIPQFFGDLVISLLVATVLCLVFESPFIVLEKELLGGRNKSSKSGPERIPSNGLKVC